MVLTEGYDLPDLGCIVLARPTRSMGLYRQMVGRGLRPAPGKDHCLVLDHSGATLRHGRVEDPVIWTLDEDTKAESPGQDARHRDPSERELLACPKCSAIRTAGRPCPECGHMPRRPGQHLDVVDADLVLLDRRGRLHPHQHTPEMKHDVHRQLVGIAMQRGYKRGWASHKFREKFGHWPNRRTSSQRSRQPRFWHGERSGQIAYAKAMEKEARHG